ncbi:type II toxin-antitoxin system VapC family toxin [Sphingomonas canadensis]|uniref:Type II toxin-antitoxin system VapC family toxin n=1 Tax=Sphingomonas canadensis TaxID=1219257 RepID=A0ABW3HCN0_9SPHN|nr:type II toxin-antitoxin system VapC family toxin [Sphingomonas canadensis]MCW3837088.1 type II toxin-antitoxin system VapC family toxin [Sphingomonas canadensis]
MSDAYVLDASAVLAVLFGEPGAENIYPLLRLSLISAVNLSETVAKAQERGVPDSEMELSLKEFPLAVVPFDAEQAVAAGRLRAATRSLGLSFGDRACLALAMAKGAVAVTMDRSWAALDLPVAVQVARA